MPPTSDVTPLWLSHHWPGDYERCSVVRGRHICRRCLVLYPMAFIVMIGALVVSSDFTLPGWVFGVLAAPALVEFCVEHLSSIRYSPRRQVVLSVLAGVGLGVGFARYLEHPTDAWFWATAVGFLLIGGLAALVGSRKQQA